MVKDIRRGASWSAPFLFTEVDGAVFFSAADRTHGRELWRSDATAAGTVLVADIWPGPKGSGPG